MIRTWTPESENEKPPKNEKAQLVRAWFERLPRMRAQIQQQEERIAQLEQSQRQSLEIIEKLAEQNAQVVATVGALRIGAQRLMWASVVLGLGLIGLGVYVLRH